MIWLSRSLALAEADAGAELKYHEPGEAGNRATSVSHSQKHLEHGAEKTQVQDVPAGAGRLPLASVGLV